MTNQPNNTNNTANLANNDPNHIPDNSNRTANSQPVNPMACDLETGICGEAGPNEISWIDLNEPQAKAQLYYVTDPICSHCWALEPVLRKFKEQYGHYMDVHTVMGGLLPGWDGFADVSNGIGRPADVAGHWQEVGQHSRMPIDGTLWLDNPIASSYPPSRVFKQLQLISEPLAQTYLRRAREAVFAFNRNIGDTEVLTDLVNRLGQDGAAIVAEAMTDAGLERLEQDFALSRSLHVSGFPTLVMVNEQKKGVKVVGARTLEQYKNALEQVLGISVEPRPVAPLATMLQQESFLFAKEIEVLYDIAPTDLNDFLAQSLAPHTFATGQWLGETWIAVPDYSEKDKLG